MLPMLSLGPLSLPTQPFLLLLGIWLGLWVSEKYAARHAIHANQLSALVLRALIFGLLGARIGFVLRHLNSFASAPLSALTPNLTMLDLESGLLTGGLVAIIYAQRHKIPAWPLMDALTPGLAVFALAYWLGAFASGDAYGSPSSLPWAIPLWGETRHPVQLYAALGAAAAAWFSWPRGITPPAPGARFLTFCALTAASLLVAETWRGDPVYWLGVVRSGQIIAWLLLAASLYLLGRRLR